MTTREKMLKILESMSDEQLKSLLRAYAASRKPAAEGSATDAGKEAPEGPVFYTVAPDRLEELEADTEYMDKNSAAYRWISAVRALPKRFTEPAYHGRELVEHATEVWRQNIRGLDEVFDKLLLHVVRYGNTGRMQPLLFVGEPGCGKTTIAKLVPQMLGLPVHYISGPRCASGRGLSGSGRIYLEADYGEIVRGSIATGCANPGFVIDEVDKIPTFSGHGGTFVNELLTLTDDNNSSFTENFLQMQLDYSRSIFIMTANDLSAVSEPLASRCDIIEFPACDEQQIREIVRSFTLPEELRSYGLDGAAATVNIERLVSALYANGVRDLRKYQAAVKSVVSSAYLRSVREGGVLELRDSDVDAAVAGLRAGKNSRPIGFFA